MACIQWEGVGRTFLLSASYLLVSGTFKRMSFVCLKEEGFDPGFPWCLSSPMSFRLWRELTATATSLFVKLGFISNSLTVTFVEWQAFKGWHPLVSTMAYWATACQMGSGNSYLSSVTNEKESEKKIYFHWSWNVSSHVCCRGYHIEHSCSCEVVIVCLTVPHSVSFR